MKSTQCGKDWIFFFNDTATTDIYTLTLRDALPISARAPRRKRVRLRHPAGDPGRRDGEAPGHGGRPGGRRDRKSTRLNSSHANISYAVFCLKKPIHSNLTLLHVPSLVLASPPAVSV